MKKILFILQDSFVNKTAGIELYTHNLAKSFSKKKYDVRIVAKNSKNSNEEILFDDINYNLISKSKYGLINSFLFPVRVARYIKREKPDLIHGVTFFPIGLYCLIYKQLFRSPTLIHIHASDVYLVNDRIMQLFSKAIIKYNSRIIGITEHVCRKLIEKSQFYQIPIKSIPISTKYKIKDIDKKKETRKRILCVGNFRALKGIRRLIHVLCLLKNIDKNYNLTIVGGAQTPSSIEYREECIKDATKLSIIESINFAGSVKSSEMNKYYANSDVLSISSLSEGFPSIILEAAANNIPIISTAVGGIPEFLDDFCISQTNDLSEFALRIHNICVNRKLRKKAIENNRRRLFNEYSFETTSRIFSEIYEKEIYV